MTTTLKRDGYGALCATSTTTPGDRAGLTAALALAAAAAKKGLIPVARDTISFDRRGRADGRAVHHEAYDIAARPARVLVCVRETEGSRYGVRTVSKTYFVISRTGAGIAAMPAPKAIAAKAAKAAGQTLGTALAILAGEKKLPGSPLHTEVGFKILRRVEGGYESVWDGSAWIIGRTRTEAARDDHRGGLYFYRDYARAVSAARENSVFRADTNHRRLAVVYVRASGRVIRYNDGKYAATRITPLEDIGSTL